MSTAHNAINNSVGTSGTTTSLSRARSASGQWDGFDDQTDTFGMYNNAGTPEAAVAANIGSYCLDTTNGEMYIKSTDTVNTGWILLTTAVVPTVTAFTPVLEFGGASVGITYSTQFGRYQRIGNMLFYSISFDLTSKGSSVGAAVITGLPVASSALNYGTSNCHFSLVTIPGGQSTFTSFVTSGAATITLSSTGTNTANLAVTDTEFANTSSVLLSGLYFTA